MTRNFLAVFPASAVKSAAHFAHDVSQFPGVPGGQKCTFSNKLRTYIVYTWKFRILARGMCVRYLRRERPVNYVSGRRYKARAFQQRENRVFTLVSEFPRIHIVHYTYVNKGERFARD